MATRKNKKKIKNGGSPIANEIIGQVIPRKVQDRINEDVLPKGSKGKKK